MMTPTLIFGCVSFSLGLIGDCLNIFQCIYLVQLGWNESRVGFALMLMGVSSLIFQTFAGDYIDKTSFDRRKLLNAASCSTAFSALVILFVREGNRDHFLIYTSKIIQGMSASFLAPCLGAVTLAFFGPRYFDEKMANNLLCNHLGTLGSAVLAGTAAYILYPDIKYSFLILAFALLSAIFFITLLPKGDPMMGRGFHGENENKLDNQRDWVEKTDQENTKDVSLGTTKVQEAASYWDVFSDRTVFILCLSGFFFSFCKCECFTSFR